VAHKNACIKLQAVTGVVQFKSKCIVQVLLTVNTLLPAVTSSDVTMTLIVGRATAAAPGCYSCIGAAAGVHSLHLNSLQTGVKQTTHNEPCSLSALTLGRRGRTVDILAA
jgi:hypothetical protein